MLYSSLNKTKVFGGRFSSSAHKREKCEKQIESFSVPCLDALDVCKELLELNVSLIVVAFIFLEKKKIFYCFCFWGVLGVVRQRGPSRREKEYLSDRCQGCMCVRGLLSLWTLEVVVTLRFVCRSRRGKWKKRIGNYFHIIDLFLDAGNLT